MRKILNDIKTLVAVAAMATALASCSGSDGGDSIEAPQQPATQTDEPKTYTMTIEATIGDDEALTRALELDESGAKPVLKATWTKGDKVYVYEQLSNSESPGSGASTSIGSSTSSSTTYRLAGTLTAQSSGASTTLSGEVTLAGPQSTLTLYYGSPSYDYTGQVGTLADIAAKYDYASTYLYYNKYTLENGKVVVNDGVSLNFANLQAIVKFTLTDTDGYALSANSLTVGATGEYTYRVGHTIPTESTSESFTDITSFTVTPEGGATNVIYVAMPMISSGNAYPIRLDAACTDWNYFYEKASVTFAASKYYEVTVKMKRIVDLSKLSADYSTRPYDMLTGTLASGKHITIPANGSVTLKNATISDASQSGITCEGSATITLEGANSVKGTARLCCGIQAGPANTTLTIQGSGSLTAQGGEFSAGIGSNGESGTHSGNITISGGTIEATGGDNAAGIGGGLGGTCGDINISEGTITATGGYCAAGIGGGDASTCGNITITGGSGSATGASSGPWDIGAGLHGTCGAISIAPNTISGLNPSDGVTCKFKVHYYHDKYSNNPRQDGYDEITIIIDGIAHEYYLERVNYGEEITIILPKKSNATLHFNAEHNIYTTLEGVDLTKDTDLGIINIYET